MGLDFEDVLKALARANEASLKAGLPGIFTPPPAPNNSNGVQP
jgi:hypothetical protein